MFDIILAHDKNGLIGTNNGITWIIDEDMRFFYRKTTDVDLPCIKNIIIMGFNTFLSINCVPLPNRINIIITSKTMNDNNNNENLIYAHGFQHALTLSMLIKNRGHIFVIGGGSIYNQAFNHPLLKYAYITKINNSYEDPDEDENNLYIDINYNNMLQKIKTTRCKTMDKKTNKIVDVTFSKYINKYYYSEKSNL